MQTHPFMKGKKLLQQIEKHGYKAYFVGGSVRDSIMEREIGDIDIATSATPKDVKHIFENVIPVGIEHGTVLVRWEGESYEVTTFRMEDTYSDRRHPDHVSFVQTIDQDLERRDFTMNAIAMDTSGNIIDPFSGQSDIKNKQIRAVGDSYERFREDPLRIIRAIRFSSQLGFRVETETFNAMLEVKEALSTLAVERLASEMTHFFAGEFVALGMTYMQDTGILYELPVFKEHPEIEQLLPGSILPLSTFSEVIAMLHYLQPTVSISEWARQWKVSNRTKKEAIRLYHALNYWRVHGLDVWLAYSLLWKHIPQFIRLATLLYPEDVPDEDDLLHMKMRAPIQSERDLSLDGQDVSNMFPNQKKGAWIGEFLADMEYAVVTGSVKNNQYALKEWVRCHPLKEN